MRDATENVSGQNSTTGNNIIISVSSNASIEYYIIITMRFYFIVNFIGITTPSPA